jgi:hypothetical protein
VTCIHDAGRFLDQSVRPPECTSFQQSFGRLSAAISLPPRIGVATLQGHWWIAL